MLYIFLDTNVYIRYLTQGRPGCEPQFFQRLKQLIKNGEARLLLPEIVRLELEKFWRHMETDIAGKVKEMKEGLQAYFKGQAGKLWNELNDMQDEMLKSLDKIGQQKVEAAKKLYQELQDLFGAEHVESIAFDQETWYRARRRLIAGRMPHKESKSAGEKKQQKQSDRLDQESDACIVESLRSYFAANEEEGVLYFCSENVNDFGHRGKERIYLDSTIREELPKGPYFTDLKGLIEFRDNPIDIKDPTPEEEKKDIELEMARQASLLREKAQQLMLLQERLQQDAERHWRLYGMTPALEEYARAAFAYDPVYYQHQPLYPPLPLLSEATAPPTTTEGPVAGRSTDTVKNVRAQDKTPPEKPRNVDSNPPA